MLNIHPMNSKTIESIFLKYQEYICENQKKQIFTEIHTFLTETMNHISDTDEELLENIQNQKKFYMNDIIYYKIILKQILNQEFFISKFNIVFQNEKERNFGIKLLQNAQIFGEVGYYQLYINDSMNFYLGQSPKIIKNESLNREKRIMTRNYSKFIVTISDINEDGSYYIPLYPMGTLQYLFNYQFLHPNEPRVELSIVDKIVMIIEIATTMKDLHFYGEYHGDLSSQKIFINASKDAYIGSIYHNRDYEYQLQPCVKGSYFGRAPEVHEKMENIGLNAEFSFEEQKLNDIFSFGVLMYEILTETLAEVLLFKLCYHSKMRMHVLKFHYFDALMNYDKNGVFQKDSMCEMKSIIEKCMKNDINERYQSFNKIINDIRDSKIYIENKEEIEFRIQNATESGDYKCTLSDIVEGYCRGKFLCKKYIKSFLSKYSQIINNDELIKIKIKINDDIIKTIFNSFKNK